MIGGIVIIDGPDNSGKTTLAKRLGSDLGETPHTYVHCTYPRDTSQFIYHMNIMQDAVARANNGEVVLMDRSFFSEDVYGEVCREGTSLGYLSRFIYRQLLSVPHHIYFTHEVFPHNKPEEFSAEQRKNTQAAFEQLLHFRYNPFNTTFPFITQVLLAGLNNGDYASVSRLNGQAAIDSVTVNDLFEAFNRCQEKRSNASASWYIIDTTQKWSFAAGSYNRPSICLTKTMHDLCVSEWHTRWVKATGMSDDVLVFNPKVVERMNNRKVLLLCDGRSEYWLHVLNELGVRNPFVLCVNDNDTTCKSHEVHKFFRKTWK